MMLGKLQQVKLERAFRFFDLNGHGYLERIDYITIPDRLAAARDLDQNLPVYTKAHAVYEQFWVAYRQAADSDNDQHLSLDEWMTFWSGSLNRIADEMLSSGVSPGLQALKAIAALTFDLLDGDSNGLVTQEEYATWYASGAGEADTIAAFQKLDLNGDGYLTRHEVEQIIKEFYLSNDPEAPGNHLLGVLF